MAPTKRKSLRSKASAASKPSSAPSLSSPRPSTSAAAPATDDSPFPCFSSTKRDKRSIKHSLLLSKISKSAPRGASGAGVKKRRRPSKKLVTTLDALADALPDASVADAATSSNRPGAMAGADADAHDEGIDVPGAQARIIVKNRSLKSRPGALKRKAAIEARERQRFERNLAEMAKGPQQQHVADVGMAEAGEAQNAGAADGAASTADRWKALRAFIGGTMEKR